MTICLTGYARTGREIIAENGFKASVAPMLSTEWSQTPAISSESFDPAIAACTLHVPVGCADEYWENGWDKFARIVDDIITEGISTVMEDADSRIVRYSITGQPIRETRPNQIYIERDWRGNSRKIIAK